MDANLNLIDDIVLAEKNTRKMGVTALRRDPKANVLYAGVFQDIYILEWNGMSFTTIRIIDGIHSCKYYC